MADEKVVEVKTEAKTEEKTPAAPTPQSWWKQIITPALVIVALGATITIGVAVAQVKDMKVDVKVLQDDSVANKIDHARWDEVRKRFERVADRMEQVQKARDEGK